jgi:hypothetical protein
MWWSGRDVFRRGEVAQREVFLSSIPKERALFVVSRSVVLRIQTGEVSGTLFARFG